MEAVSLGGTSATKPLVTDFRVLQTKLLINEKVNEVDYQDVAI
ncbi:hypothetical protein AAIE21_13050 [Paenibacillus sp. 102]